MIFFIPVERLAFFTFLPLRCHSFLILPRYLAPVFFARKGIAEDPACLSNNPVLQENEVGWAAN
jgi:hypothetical protein